MKNILVFTTTFPKFTTWDATPGFVYDLSKRLQKLWLQIIVLTPRVPWSKKYEEKDWMKIYRYSYFFTDKLEKLNDWAILPNLKQNKLLYFQVPFLLLFWFINLVKLVKKEKIDTIHAHWIIPQWFLAVLYKKIFNKKIKIICTSLWADIFWLKGFIGTTIKKYTLKHIDYLTVMTFAMKVESQLLWIKKNKIEVIPMWVDTNIFNPNKFDKSIRKRYDINEKLLLFVGRLAEKKWVYYLIEAMKLITKKYSKTKLIIIWNGPLENKLKKQVNKLNLKNNVIFISSMEHNKLAIYYATADLFIWPSIIAKDWDREWLPVSFIEAISSWTLLLWTDLPWNKDLIIEWKNWYFIKQKDSEDIYRKVIKIIENKNNIFKKNKFWNVINSKFSWEIISKKYFNLIK